VVQLGVEIAHSAFLWGKVSDQVT